MPATTAKDWDQVRAAFAASIMVNTPLSSLAQNLEGPEWPIKAGEETPAAYIDLSFDEVTELLALKGQLPERIDQLTEILRDTLAFDDPFGDMVAQSEATSERDNPLLKNLARLDIPEGHPIELTALSQDTREFCALEKLTTLGEFGVFAQNMAQSVIVGGDFRDLLNALSHVDERVLARLLPFRPGAKGLHLVEAVAMIVRPLPAATRADPPLDLHERVTTLVRHFAAEAAELRAQVEAGTPLSRVVAVLNDPPLESAVTALLQPHLAPVAPAPAKKAGWVSRLFGK